MATWMVWARSAAEIPVVTPSAASMDSVKAVPNREVFLDDICGRCRASQISALSGRQIRPRACLAMKLMTSGVTFSAAMVRSPSFSRSSSSTIDQHPAGPEVLDGLRDGGERHGLSIRIAIGGRSESDFRRQKAESRRQKTGSRPAASTTFKGRVSDRDQRSFGAIFVDF